MRLLPQSRRCREREERSGSITQRSIPSLFVNLLWRLFIFFNVLETLKYASAPHPAPDTRPAQSFLFTWRTLWDHGGPQEAYITPPAPLRPCLPSPLPLGAREAAAGDHRACSPQKLDLEASRAVPAPAGAPVCGPACDRPGKGWRWAAPSPAEEAKRPSGPTLCPSPSPPRVEGPCLLGWGTHPGSHLEGVGRWLWGALKASPGLYIQDVEKVGGLGLAGEAEVEAEAVYSTRAIVVELAGGSGRMLGGSAPSPAPGARPLQPGARRLLPTS